jgi:hypothetical protein
MVWITKKKRNMILVFLQTVPVEPFVSGIVILGSVQDCPMHRLAENRKMKHQDFSETVIF